MEDRDELLSALQFDDLDIAGAEAKLESAFEGGLVDLFTYQDVKGKAQSARRAISEYKRQYGPGSKYRRQRGLRDLMSVLLGGSGPSNMTRFLRSKAYDFGIQMKTTDFLESVQALAVGSATQASSVFVARARATKQLELAQLGYKRFRA